MRKTRAKLAVMRTSLVKSSMTQLGWRKKDQITDNTEENNCKSICIHIVIIYFKTNLRDVNFRKFRVSR